MNSHSSRSNAAFSSNTGSGGAYEMRLTALVSMLSGQRLTMTPKNWRVQTTISPHGCDVNSCWAQDLHEEKQRRGFPACEASSGAGIRFRLTPVVFRPLPIDVMWACYCHIVVYMAMLITSTVIMTDCLLDLLHDDLHDETSKCRHPHRY